MRRREFISLIAGATVWPFAARAQQPAMPVVGFLGVVSGPEAIPDLLAAFRRGLAEAGFVEGKNLVIEYRFANFRPELMLEGAGDLSRRNVNVIFAGIPEAVAAARDATTSIPIVGVDLESDPLAKGYVKSFARPGGNMTGMFLDFPELTGKQVGLLKDIVPGLFRLAVIGMPNLNAAQFAAAEIAARTLGLEPQMLEVRVLDDFEQALGSAKKKHVEAGILLSSPLVWISSKQIAEQALAKQLPFVFMFDIFPKSGGLISYGPNVADIYRRSGIYVGKILNGAKPSDLPIQRPERFDLVINLKTATALGLNIPTQLQQLADEVIE